MIDSFCLAWNPESLARTLSPYVLLVAGLALCLYLFISLKAETGALRRRALEDRKQSAALELSLAEARSAIQVLEAALRDVERQTGMLVPPEPARSGLNISKRTQVLRMHRTGQDVPGIAAALALPRAEVELLVKVHQIAVQQI